MEITAMVAKLLSVAAVVAFAGAANAAAFKVQGAVDMGHTGGLGMPITGDFSTVNPGLPVALLGAGAQIGASTAPSFAAGSAVTATSFAAVYFVTGGVNSGISPGGNDGIQIFQASSAAAYGTPDVKIFIRDNGVDKNVTFNGLGSFGTAGSALSQSYRLQQYGQGLWVEAVVPTPGAAALFGVAGLAAARRRR